jgi:hypothetical protein
MSTGLQARHCGFRRTDASRSTLLIKGVRVDVSYRTWRGFLALAVGLNSRRSLRTNGKDSHTSRAPFMSRGLVRLPMPENKEAIRSDGVATSSGEELCRPRRLCSSDAESNSSDDTSSRSPSTTATCVLGGTWVVTSEGRLACVWKRVLSERPQEQLPSGDGTGG